MRCLSAYLQRMAEEQCRWGSPHKTLPSCFLAHHRSHQPIKGSAPHARGAQRNKGKRGAQIKDSKERIPWTGPFQGCHRTASASVSSHKTHQDKSMLEHPLDQEWLLPNGTRHIRCQGIRIVQDLLWILWKEPKARKEVIQGGTNMEKTTGG